MQLAMAKLTWKLELSAARVAVMLGAEVSNSIVSEIRRAEDHIVRPDTIKHKQDVLYAVLLSKIKLGAALTNIWILKIGVI